MEVMKSQVLALTSTLQVKPRIYLPSSVRGEPVEPILSPV
jgi:hypothetical protein